MDRFKDFVSQMSRHNLALRKLCSGWGKRRLRDQITKAIGHLTDSRRDALDFDVLLDPYFNAITLDSRQFGRTVLDCFWTVFVSSFPDSFPGDDLTERILTTVIGIYKSDYSDDTQLKFCKIISASFSAPSGALFVHAGLLLQCFDFLLQIHSRTESAVVQEVASMTLQDQVRSFCDR
jgi:hypothetical protein